MPNHKPSILIADDHPLYRDALTAVFERASDFEAAPPAASLEAALGAMQADPPTFALLDLNMPGMNGVTSIARVRAAHPDTGIAIISGSSSAGLIREILAAGARGYLPKTLDPEMILAAVRLMLAGAVYLSPDVLLESSGPYAIRDPADSSALTSHELDVLRMVSNGSTNGEIARKAGITEIRVKLDTRRILTKLGVRNRTEAAALAASRNLL